MMQQIKESAGNSEPVIDSKKVLMARKATWTLKELGRKVKEPAP